MPYIDNDRREELKSLYKRMVKSGLKANGDINYLLFKYCKETVKPSYNEYKNFIGELDCCIREIYRELVAPYENSKKEENGQV